MDGNSEHEKSQRNKIIEREFMFTNYKDCQYNDEIILKLQQRFKSDHHNVYTSQINNIALSSKDDKRLQTFNKIITCPYETNEFTPCKSEMLSKI